MEAEVNSEMAYWKSSSTGNEIQDFLPKRDLKVKLQSEEEESFTKRWTQQNKGPIVNYVPGRGVVVVIVFQNWTPQKFWGKNYTPFGIVLWKTYPNPSPVEAIILSVLSLTDFDSGFIEGHFQFYF